MIDSINIRPGVSVLSVLPHLNYRPWFALAEFVDNALQSFLENKQALEALHGRDFRLAVHIETDSGGEGTIVIRDNAAGIHASEYLRAFRPAELPPDRTSLSEFGMGMKSAACWFSPTWSVRTTALGESVERRVAFDINNIVRDEIEELEVTEVPASPDDHYTEIKLERLNRMPTGRTLGKIKDHLTDIYRVFVRNDELRLFFNGDQLIYRPPEILEAPYFKTPDGETVIWRKEIRFDFGEGLGASGFAAILKKASVSRAGFALFRRKRLIQGSGDEGYRPEKIFGKPNSFAYQRVFGELHLHGFEVSHTKDGFRWDENEEPFLDILRDELANGDLPLLQQAREYRVQASWRELKSGAEKATTRVSGTIEEFVPPVLANLPAASKEMSLPSKLEQASKASHRQIDVDFLDRSWTILLELSDDASIGDWLSISDSCGESANREQSGGRRIVGMRMALRHPFVERFAGADSDQIETLLRVAAAIGLAEVAARESGVHMAGVIRSNVNELLRSAMWRT